MITTQVAQTARIGEPLVVAVTLEGDQSGTAVALTVAPRWVPDVAAPTLTQAFVLGTPVTIDGHTTTSATATVDVAQVATLVPGIVYVWRLRIDDGPTVMRGTIEVVHAWD